ncbi:MAG: 4-hydroxy-tetrahydrodipicolinate synthase [Planctomycetota bacterium]|nr:4-hydroxy-tetrahydrodipicolinate synthase [Planctomycetota bacterium]
MIVPHPRCSFQGSFAAIPTPFSNGAVDWAALREHLEFLLARDTDGIVVCGTTGESATLTEDERRELIHKTLAIVARRVPVIAGVGTNDTRTTIEHARFAESVRVDGLLVVTPYYNKPSPRGLVLHYSAVAESVTTPIVLYNVPSRTGVDMTPEVVAELGNKYAHVVAVKEALPSLERVKRLVAETPVAVLSGDDASTVDFVGLGAVGTISVLANVMPAEVAEIVRCALPAGDSKRGAHLAERTAPLTRALFIESNPVPVKAVLAQILAAYPADVRLPLAPLTDASRAFLASAMTASGMA